MLIKEGDETIGNHKQIKIKPFKPARSIPALTGAAIYVSGMDVNKLNTLLCISGMASFLFCAAGTSNASSEAESAEARDLVHSDSHGSHVLPLLHRTLQPLLRGGSRFKANVECLTCSDTLSR